MTEELRQFLAKHNFSSINTCCPIGKSILHFAAAEDRYDLVDEIIKLYPLVNPVDNQGQTPLFEAVKHQSLKVLLHLVSNHEAMLHYKNKKGLTALQCIGLERAESEPSTPLIWTAIEQTMAVILTCGTLPPDLTAFNNHYDQRHLQSTASPSSQSGQETKKQAEEFNGSATKSSSLSHVLNTPSAFSSVCIATITPEQDANLNKQSIQDALKNTLNKVLQHKTAQETQLEQTIAGCAITCQEILSESERVLAKITKKAEQNNGLLYTIPCCPAVVKDIIKACNLLSAEHKKIKEAVPSNPVREKTFLLMVPLILGIALEQATLYRQREIKKSLEHLPAEKTALTNSPDLATMRDESHLKPDFQYINNTLREYLEQCKKILSPVLQEFQFDSIMSKSFGMVPGNFKQQLTIAQIEKFLKQMQEEFEKTSAELSEKLKREFPADSRVFSLANFWKQLCLNRKNMQTVQIGSAFQRITTQLHNLKVVAQQLKTLFSIDYQDNIDPFATLHALQMKYPKQNLQQAEAMLVQYMTHSRTLLADLLSTKQTMTFFFQEHDFQIIHYAECLKIMGSKMENLDTQTRDQVLKHCALLAQQYSQKQATPAVSFEQAQAAERKHAKEKEAAARLERAKKEAEAQKAAADRKAKIEAQLNEAAALQKIKQTLTPTIQALNSPQFDLLQQCLDPKQDLHDKIDSEDFALLVSKLAHFEIKETSQGKMIYFNNRSLTSFHREHGKKLDGEVLKKFKEVFDKLQMTPKSLIEWRAEKTRAHAKASLKF